MRIGGDTTSEWMATRFQPGRPGVRGDRAAATTAEQVAGTSPPPVESPEEAEAAKTRDPGPKTTEELTEKERDVVAKLKARDSEVRAHEAAHAAAAGAFGGGASYSYVTGPDGNRYAVGGEVPVRISGGSSPEEAIRNAAQVRAAALSPAEPSAQDRAVAAEASAMEAAARIELSERRSAETEAANAQASKRSEETPVVRKAPRRDDEVRAGAAAEPTPSASSLEETSEAPPPAIDFKPDPDAIMQKLEQERLSSRGSWRHLHMASGCGTCAANVTAYS